MMHRRLKDVQLRMCKSIKTPTKELRLHGIYLEKMSKNAYGLRLIDFIK